MKYYRIHSADIAWLTKQPRGIFTVIAKLDQAGTLTKEESEEYHRLHDYFEEILPVPPFYEKTGNAEGAVTWFKDTDAAANVYKQMTFYRKTAAKYGVPLYISECDDVPGEVIYEDDFQVAVVGQKEGLQITVNPIEKE